jgi:hypothetical protein
MAAIRNFLRGRDLTACTIDPCTVAATGVITVVTGSGASFRTLLDSVKITQRVTTEMIMSVDDIIENNVVLYDGYDIEITEILTRKTATGGGGPYEPKLPVLYYGGWDYFRLTLSKGGKTYVVYGVRQSLDDGVTGQGKQTATMRLNAVNVNVDNSGVASIAYGDTA